MKHGRFLLIVLAVLIAAATGARADDITVSFGYYDLPQGFAGNPNALPNPWFGSPNTIFIGDPGQAAGGDPDESGILIYNNGSSSVVISGVQTTGSYVYNGSGAWLAGYVLAPGQSLIYSTEPGGNFDGSDLPPLPGIVFSINGTPYLANGPCNPAVDLGGCVDGLILNGSVFGSANETLPWTEVDDVNLGGATPEPGTLALFGSGLFTLVGTARRRMGR